MSTTPSLSVLHLVGSSETRFYFECSFLYAKNACRFEQERVKNYYALLLPPCNAGNGRVALLEDEIPAEMSADDVLNRCEAGAADGITMVSVTEFLGLAGRGPAESGCYFRHPLQLVVPHMFDRAGMTTWRMMVEDVLRLPVAGMPGAANVLGQDKVATRLVLGQQGASEGARSPIPQGFAVWRRDLPRDLGTDDMAPLIERVRAEVGGFPVMIKSPLEDNSRGLHLVGRAYAEKKRTLGDSAELESELEAELCEKLKDVLSYGDAALFEEFIPGREFRCGVIEQKGGNNLDAYRIDAPAVDRAAPAACAERRLAPIPVMVEYIMTNPKMPIRTAADKLSKGDKGQMVMTKCTRRYVSSSPDQQRTDHDDDEMNVHPIEAALQAEIEGLVERAHDALGCGEYSIFDIRVDDRDPSHPRPYIIECCAFWSFTPKSAISLLLTASGLAFERVVLDMWKEKALSREKAAALVSQEGPAL